MGARYQVITAVMAAPTTMSPPVTRASLTASHRAGERSGSRPAARCRIRVPGRSATRRPGPRSARGRSGHGPERDVDLGAEPVREGVDRCRAAGPLAAGQARDQAVVAERRAHRGAEQDRVDREGGEQGQAGYGLAAVLPPADPDHRDDRLAGRPGPRRGLGGIVCCRRLGGRCR